MQYAIGFVVLFILAILAIPFAFAGYGAFVVLQSFFG